MVQNNKKISGLFAVDVDGTLITDSGSITETVFDAIERAVSAGWEFVIASGRTFYAAKTVIEELPFLRYAVLSNGACIMNVKDSSILHMETLNSGIVREIVNVTREKGAIPALYDTNMMHQKVYYDTLDGACKFFSWYVSEDPRCVRIGDVMEYIDDVLQVGMIAERDIIFSIRDALHGISARVIALPFESARFGGKNREFWFLQIVGEHVSKLNALRRIAGWLEIPSGPIVAVGDNYNDAEMIRGADVGVAMGNAPDEIKELAREVVGPNNGSGLAEAVDSILLSDKYFAE